MPAHRRVATLPRPLHAKQRGARLSATRSTPCPAQSAHARTARNSTRRSGMPVMASAGVRAATVNTSRVGEEEEEASASSLALGGRGARRRGGRSSRRAVGLECSQGARLYDSNAVAAFGARRVGQIRAARRVGEARARTARPARPSCYCLGPAAPAPAAAATLSGSIADDDEAPSCFLLMWMGGREERASDEEARGERARARHRRWRADKSARRHPCSRPLHNERTNASSFALCSHYLKRASILSDER